MTRHNDGDISSETHSNDKRANEESHPSESIERSLRAAVQKAKRAVSRTVGKIFKKIES
jgi:hypothetical protein